jgi:hypothetical protein
MDDGSDPDPRRVGTWMVALGILLVMAGCLLLLNLPETRWGYYYSSPEHDGVLLVGLGGLCFLVGLRNIRGATKVDSIDEGQ